MSIPSLDAYQVWLRLIDDDDLYEAVIAGTHASLAAAKGLGASELAVLDQFHRSPGTRWNVENLRFRAATKAAAALASYLPRTISMLTNGDEDWLQEIAFEYLSFHRWQELGHFALSECERFGAYLHKRILKRRRPPEHIEAVAAFELAVVAVLRKTASISAEQWPTGAAPDDDTIAAIRPRPSPASTVVELPVDLREWIRSGDPKVGQVKPDPISVLVVVPSLRDPHRVQILSDGARLLLGAFAGDATVGEIATRFAAEHGFEAADVHGMARRWLRDRTLAAG